MPEQLTIRPLASHEWDEVARLIFTSTNDWYERNLNRRVFQDHPSACRIFPEVYERLDPGCCLVVERDGELIGSCFYHPRDTHVAVGIVNVRTGVAGRGVAKRMMEEVLARAGDKPVRLVSSVMNLDSYSLYTRLGFRPAVLYQDMVLPEGDPLKSVDTNGVRTARGEDLAALADLEEELVGIRRERDFRHFLENPEGIWHGSVWESEHGMEGFLFSVNHPGCRMLGPGAMRGEEAAMGLIAAERARFGETSPVFLVPAGASGLVQALYALGARNCEMHVAQVLGPASGPEGIVMPTFLPETG